PVAARVVLGQDRHDFFQRAAGLVPAGYPSAGIDPVLLPISWSIWYEGSNRPQGQEEPRCNASVIRPSRSSASYVRPMSSWPRERAEPTSARSWASPRTPWTAGATSTAA